MDLLPLLFVLGICSSLAIGNDVKTAAPEDLDGSGDDEDFSGSGFSVEDDSEDGDVLSTPAAPLVTTVTQVSTAPKLDIAFEETTEENATQHTPTTKPNDPVEDVFAVHPVGKEPFVEEGTTLEPTSHQTSVEPVNDVKKHHHHHHHHHHHTTMPVTSTPAKFDVIEETTASPAVIEETTASPAEVEKPFVTPEETTTSTPDEGDVDDLVEVMPTPEDSGVQHVDHPETTSGLTSTSSTHEETTVDLADIAEIPVFVDSEEKTTVADDADKHHHHHHHHHHHQTTTTATTAIPLDGSDVFTETEKPDYPEPDDQDHEEATTTPPSEDKHHDHKHHHHHTTTPEATQSTVSEQPIGHTQAPKGRRINVPPAETTTEISVMSEEEPVGSTVQYVHPVSPTQDDDSADSSEDESGDGSVEGDDIFFEATVPLDKSDRMAPAPDDGSSNASHGIMERKELLAGIIAGGIAGLVFAASLVAFVLYRMKKKDEGSYSLEEPKQSNGGYQKPREQREFYA